MKHEVSKVNYGDFEEVRLEEIRLELEAKEWRDSCIRSDIRRYHKMQSTPPGKMYKLIPYGGYWSVIWKTLRFYGFALPAFLRSDLP